MLEYICISIILLVFIPIIYIRIRYPFWSTQPIFHSYDFSNVNNNKVTFKETFTDVLTKNVRQNELSLYMEPMRETLQLASDAGFVLHDTISLKECSGEDNQFLYVLKRPN